MPVIRYSDVKFGAQNNSVKIYQKALTVKGHATVADGWFGAQTKAATVAFQKKVFKVASGIPGRLTFGKLGLTNGSPPVPAGGSEPAQNMSRTTYGGRTVNQRTKAMLTTAAGYYGKGFVLAQGSYNRSVAASAGTHDGGGVVDISVSGMSSAQRQQAVKALRRAGFAAWLRSPAEGFSYHIHACAIGDKDMSAVARNQVQAYFNGRNGLARNGPDSSPGVGRPFPAWAKKYDR